MKSLACMIVGALAAAATLGAPVAAAAAEKAAAPYTKEQLARGAKDAPMVVQSAGLPCTIVDAAFISEGEGKNPDDPKSKDIKVANYEVACQQGLGYILQSYVGLPVKTYDCISVSGSTAACRLPEDLDNAKMVSGLVTAAGKTCAVNNERALGATKTGDRFFEVGCAEGVGFVLDVPPPSANKPPVAEDCARHVGTNLECKFTTKEQIQAAMTARLTKLVAASNKPCSITNSKEIGADSSGTAYYEVACSSGLGYVLAAKNDVFVRAIDCANAASLNGGCTLTDVSKAETAESGTYTRLATAGGFPCQVAKYRYIGQDPKSNSEVVELQCSNRPDGVVAMFAADNKGPSKFYDCVAAGALGQSCKLSEPAAAYTKYTQALASRGKTTCKVSNAKWLGASTDGTNYIETACSDGLPGWVIASAKSGSASEVLSCGQAKSAGVPCTLPGNTK